MHLDVKQLRKISSEQSFDADDLETDSHCVVVAIVVVIFWGLEKAEVSPLMFDDDKPEKKGEIMFSSHTEARCFTNGNRLMHNYAEPICKSDFTTDVPCNHLQPHIQSQACILMPIRQCAWHMCTLFLDKVYGLSLIWDFGTMFTSKYIECQMPWAKQKHLGARIICLSWSNKHKIINRLNNDCA